jgi:hypothetical protein
MCKLRQRWRVIQLISEICAIRYAYAWRHRLCATAALLPANSKPLTGACRNFERLRRYRSADALFPAMGGRRRPFTPESASKWITFGPIQQFLPIFGRIKGDRRTGWCTSHLTERQLVALSTEATKFSDARLSISPDAATAIAPLAQ